MSLVNPLDTLLENIKNSLAAKLPGRVVTRSLPLDPVKEPEATLRGHVRDARGRSRNLVLMGNDIAQIWLSMEHLVSDTPPTRELLSG